MRRNQRPAAMVLLIAIIAMSTPLAAQDAAVDAIEERQARMEAVGEAAETGGNMLRGRQPFDAATAAEVFQTMNEAATGFADLFPEGSETGGDTRAAPAIFERPDEFRAAVEEFRTDTAAALDAAPDTPEAFETAFGTVAQNCRACHEEFRLDRD